MAPASTRWMTGGSVLPCADGGPIAMSQSRVERFFQDKPAPKKPVNENDATAKTAADRELSDAELEGVAGGAGEDFGRGRA
jgi:hypothetical protein